MAIRYGDENAEQELRDYLNLEGLIVKRQKRNDDETFIMLHVSHPTNKDLNAANGMILCGKNNEVINLKQLDKIKKHLNEFVTS